MDISKLAIKGKVPRYSIGQIGKSASKSMPTLFESGHQTANGGFRL